MAKAQRDAAMERMAAGEDLVAKAEQHAREFEEAQRQAREQETARMKERVRQDAEKYGPKVTMASDEIIRGTVVEAKIKG